MKRWEDQRGESVKMKAEEQWWERVMTRLKEGKKIINVSQRGGGEDKQKDGRRDGTMRGEVEGDQ